MADDRADSPPSDVSTETQTKICDACGQPFELRKRVRARRFCNDRCRNTFHLAERRRWEAEAKAAIVVVTDRLERLAKKGRR